MSASSRSRLASALLNSKMTPARERGTSSRTRSTVTRGTVASAVWLAAILAAGLARATAACRTGKMPVPLPRKMSTFSSSFSIWRVSPPVSRTNRSSASSSNCSFRFFARLRTISVASSSQPLRLESSRSKICISARLTSDL